VPTAHTTFQPDVPLQVSDTEYRSLLRAGLIATPDPNWVDASGGVPAELRDPADTAPAVETPVPAPRPRPRPASDVPSLIEPGTGNDPS
jgi:hypothetical protein